MDGLKKLVSLSAAVLAAMAPGASQAQPVKEKANTLPITKAELFAPRFHATGQFQVVELPPPPSQAVGKVLRSFGAGAVAEKQAYAFAATFAGGPAPIVVKRVLKHYRCPKRANDGGGQESVLDCDPVKIKYVLPADPTVRNPQPDCGISVDADVIYLGRKAKTIKWILDPPSDPATTSTSAPTPRIRLLAVGTDPNGEEVRGITFSDNTEDPQERGEPPMGTDPVFFPALTSPDGQSVVWARVKAQAKLAKVFYYAVVLELWSDALQDYVSCAPYDPTIANRGN